MNTVTFKRGEGPQVIHNDVEALAAITQLGLLNQLLDPRHLSDGQAGTMVYAMRGHPTHWVFVGYFHGFARAEENGYVVMAWDKQLYPPSVLDDEIALHSSQPHCLGASDIPKADEKNN